MYGKRRYGPAALLVASVLSSLVLNLLVFYAAPRLVDFAGIGGRSDKGYGTRLQFPGGEAGNLNGKTGQQDGEDLQQDAENPTGAGKAEIRLKAVIRLKMRQSALLTFLVTQRVAKMTTP